MNPKYRSVKWGLALSVLAILFAFSLGVWMGISEDSIKAGWQAAGQAVLSTLYHNDPKAIDPVLNTAWTFLIRAHLHAGAIGGATLAMSYILSRLRVPDWYKMIGSLFLGFGAIGYPFSWFYAANHATSMGKAAAKAAIHPLAVVSIGMLLVGSVAVLIPIILRFINENDSESLDHKRKAVA